MKLVHERTYNKVSSSMSDCQTRAIKKKSVRNHVFVLNSILSDVLSANKKEPIDINIMDFKQMFDTGDLSFVLNAFFEAGVTDDMLALVNEANKSVPFAVKTYNGMTKCETMNNKVMQGDMLSPLVSSIMADINI